MFSGYFTWKSGDLYPRIASSGRKMCHDSKNRPEFWIVTHLRWEFFVPKADPPPIPEMKGMLTCGAAIHCLPYHNILPEVPEIINSAASGVFQKRAEVTIFQPPQHSTAFCGQLPIALMAIQDCPAAYHPSLPCSRCASIVYPQAHCALKSLQLLPCHAESSQIARSPTTTPEKCAPNHCHRLYCTHEY